MIISLLFYILYSLQFAYFKISTKKYEKQFIKTVLT